MVNIVSCGSKLWSETFHPLSVIYFDPGSLPDSPDWITCKAGGSYRQVPAAGYGFDCDPGLPKSKGCAIRMGILYLSEITLIFMSMGFFNGLQVNDFGYRAAWTRLAVFSNCPDLHIFMAYPISYPG